ncbi:hypothetical protein MRX96_026069 [Rhipicephalus microplus]
MIADSHHRKSKGVDIYWGSWTSNGTRLFPMTLRTWWKKTAQGLATLSDQRISRCLSFTCHDHEGVTVRHRPLAQLFEDTEYACMHGADTIAPRITSELVQGLGARTSGCWPSSFDHAWLTNACEV